MSFNWQLMISRLQAVSEEKQEASLVPSYAENISFPYLQATLFATVLEDAITNMRILVECNNEIRIAKVVFDMGVHLTRKFGVSQPAVIDELEGIDYRRLECEEYKLNKLDSDRKIVLDVFKVTYTDLITNNTFKALEDKVNNFDNIDKYRLDLSEEEAKNRILRREINRQIRQQRNHIKSVIYDTNAKIDALRAKLEDANLNCEMRSRYVDMWQNARTEQHLQTINDKEAKPSSIIEYYKRRSDSEQRVHAEVELLMNIVINETLETVENWMDKYDKDMENIDLQIQIKKNDYQNMLDKRIELEETIKGHDEMMKEWIQFKEEREKLRKYKEIMHKSAIIVQAWWRGLLVRRRLGPFRIPKKRGGARRK